MASKKTAATTSAAEAQLVGCPLPAAVVARIDLMRRRVATSSSAWRVSLGASALVSTVSGSAIADGASNHGAVDVVGAGPLALTFRRTRPSTRLARRNSGAALRNAM